MKKGRAKFTTWARWNDRVPLDGIKQPGVYLIAHFARRPHGRAAFCDKRVVYIGETCGSSLRSRLNSFNRGALTGRANHGGGNTYHKEFGQRRLNSAWVAVAPCGQVGELLTSQLIRLWERQCLWGFVSRWNKLPRCNKK